MKISMVRAVVPAGKKVMVIETNSYVYYLRREGRRPIFSRRDKRAW